MDGLIVRNGRLINERRNGESGIARMARLNKSIKEDRKIRIVAEGMERAEYNKNYNSKLF
jgi:hypothetical protein